MAIVNLEMFAGESKTIRLVVTDAATAQAVDLTAAVIELQVKIRPGEPDPALIAKSLANGVVLLTQAGATMGKFDVSLVPADTATKRGLFYFDVVVTLSGSRQYAVDPGSTILIKPSVNQP